MSDHLHHRDRVRFSIRYKLALFTLAVTALAIIAVSIGSYADTQNILEKNILAHFSVLGHSRAGEIMTLIALDTEIVRSIALRMAPRDYLTVWRSGGGHMHTDLAKVQESLADAIQSAPRINQIDIIDMKGTVVASSEESAIGNDLFTAEGFQEGLSGIYAGDLYRAEGLVLYDIFIPLTDPRELEKRPVGVMRCAISPQDIFALLLDYTDLGATGEYALAMVKQGDIFYLNQLRLMPDTAFSLRVPLTSSLAEPMRRALRGESGIMEGLDYRGKNVLASYVYIPTQRWGLVTKIDVTEAFIPVNRLLTNMLMIAVLVFIFSMITVAFFAGFITRPIRVLQEATERIGTGDLDLKVSIRGHDEIGQLARAFDTMVRNLKLVTASRNELNAEIVERKEAEALARKRSEELTEALQARTNFVSTVSHELRTPLAAIKGSIDVVAGEITGSITDKQKKYLAIAKKNVDRLDRLIGGVLDFRKLESGKLAYAMREEEINAIVEEVHETMIVSVREKRLSFTLDLASAIPRVVCDRDRIIQVLSNLVNNAVKFTQRGGVTITTALTAGAIRISVTDTGEGIKDEDRHKLFQPFSQIKRIPGGTGLGLAISKEIVEAHGGEIIAESIFGSGTTITFTIPVKKAEA